MQTVQILIRRRVLRRLIWVYIVCQCPFYGMLGLNGLNSKFAVYIIQSALVISNFKALSEILRDIRTSTYQICRIEEKIFRLTTFNKYTCNWTLEVRDIVKILWKRGEIAP